jgi:hypothetical protein
MRFLRAVRVRARDETSIGTIGMPRSGTRTRPHPRRVFDVVEVNAITLAANFALIKYGGFRICLIFSACKRYGFGAENADRLVSSNDEKQVQR